MFLFIDTSVRGVIRLAVIPADPRRPIEECASEQSRDLAAFAERFFGARVRRARGIIVVAGPGSFSAIRSGVLLANIMSRTLKVPLYQVKAESLELSPPRAKPRGAESRIDLDDVRRRIGGGDLKHVRYVAPIYDQEPNVTVASSSAKRQTPNPIALNATERHHA